MSVLDIWCSMYRLVILGIVAVTAVAAAVDINDCRHFFHPHSMRCCKKSDEVRENLMKDDKFKECFDLPKDPVKCEHELCMAKKKGFATDDDKLDKTKLEEMMTKDMDDKDLLADMKKNCIDGDLENYGPPDFCEFIKMKHCLSLNMLNHCKDWNDFGDCNRLKSIVGDCVKLVS